MLTSDIETVLDLNLHLVQDLTGLQDFSALESLRLDEGGGSLNDDITVDLTANVNLRELEIWSFEGLSKLDLTGLNSLEELLVWEWQDDVITMKIDSLDLSINTNIDYISLGTMEFMEHVNLQNGNNATMSDFELHLSQGQSLPDRSMCIKVDDADAAVANTVPYSNWIINGVAPNFYGSGECTLSVNETEVLEISLYPNPTQNKFQLKSPVTIKEVEVFSMQGKQVARFSSQQNYDVSYLPTGMYFLKISTPNRIQVMRLVKQNE